MIDRLMQFEDGQLSEVDTIILFSELVQNGTAWQLQGFYGRTAANLINSGIIDKNGKIITSLENFE